MKPIIPIVLLLMIGCSNTRFDSMNYDRILVLHQTIKSLSLKCDNTDEIIKELPLIQKSANHIALYSSLRTGSPEVANSTKIVSSMVDEFVTRYNETKPSVGYCTQKLKSISDATYTIASALGAQQ